MGEKSFSKLDGIEHGQPSPDMTCSALLLAAGDTRKPPRIFDGRYC